eukprot:Blabericola_migrator_1__10912@NODE_62_length_15736_cov_138_574510_g56_i0_p9_GENE_NODE_62_length_15736_cov_138_574510_g56_i0NODE_62_length_15736_cov_138_574510_g56_i0_p9_ORF_typecomplete_len125_score25_33Prefoldin_2/PF01920_20/7_9e16TLE_N/PF03920_15/2_8e02TLE_N/PF03920_15/0_086XhlA/PF10779_9/5_7e02XhlA/PF10779_9/0_071SHE3/PF17078_5/0_14SRA1/PF07304_11/7_3e02SRA1/PF07304_11/0_5Vps5/PF09325_10/0_37DUF4404/PF14357_6/7_3e02DUF4404/PF14357_6/0_31HAUSaugmin3/PF14932_6/0_25HAUSaugmin3/PF14932_6/29AAA_13
MAEVDLDKLKELSIEYQQLSEFLNTQLTSKAKLAAQETENQVVLDELIALEEDAIVYKSVGPVLLKENKDTAKDNVEKRLKYIRDELARVEKIGEETKLKIEKLATSIASMQKVIQSQRPPSSG